MIITTLKELFVFFLSKKGLLILFTFFSVYFALAQDENEDTKNWDNQLYLSTKVTMRSPKWKFSGEIQARLEDNMQDLETLFAEGVASFPVFKNIEFVSDFRISKKPDEIVLRPGLGFLYKPYINDFQFVNQIKWQNDFHTSDGRHENALRYVLVINKQLAPRLIGSFLAGALYRWSDDFQGTELIRTGPGVTYIFNRKYNLFVNYYLSIENNHEYWEWAGIPYIQLIINLD